MGVWRWLGGVVAVASLSPAGCHRAQLGMPDAGVGVGVDAAPGAGADARGSSGDGAGPALDAGRPSGDAAGPPPGGDGGPSMPVSCPAGVGHGSAGAPPPPASVRACDAGLTPASSYSLVPDGTRTAYHRCGDLGDVASAVRVSRDGRRVAVVVAESVRLFDTGTWREIARVAHATEPIDAAALSPDGARLATSSSYIGEVTLWDTSYGRPMAIYPGTVASPGSSQLARGGGLAFSSDGRRIATSMGTIIDTTAGTSLNLANNTIRNGLNSDLWFTAADTGLLARTMYHSGDSWVGVLIERFDTVTGDLLIGVGDRVALSGDLAQAVGVVDRYGTSNYLVYGIGLPTPIMEQGLPFSLIPGVDWERTAPAALDNHGELLALADAGAAVLRIVEAQHPDQEIVRIPLVAGTSVVGVSPANELVTSGPCGTIGWDWRTGQARWAQPFAARAIAWTADGSLAVAAGPGALFRVWRADTGAELCAPPGGRAATDRVFSADGRMVLVRYDDGAAEIRDADLANPRPVAPAAVGTSPVALSTNGPTVASWADQALPSSGQTPARRLEVRRLDGSLLGVGPIDSSYRPYQTALSPDLTRALYRSDMGVRLVDIRNGTIVASWGYAGVIGFSPDGARFALAVNDGIATFTSADGSPGPVMRPAGQPVLGGSLSADWSVAVSAAPADGGTAPSNTTVVRWQTPDGPAQLIPDDDYGPAALSTDGALMVRTQLIWHEFTGDYFDTIVRDAVTGAVVQRFSDHPVTPSADGTRLFGNAGAVFCR